MVGLASRITVGESWIDTDGSGRALALPTLGLEEGINNTVIDAHILSGPTVYPATFVASALVSAAFVATMPIVVLAPGSAAPDASSSTPPARVAPARRVT